MIKINNKVAQSAAAQFLQNNGHNAKTNFTAKMTKSCMVQFLFEVVNDDELKGKLFKVDDDKTTQEEEKRIYAEVASKARAIALQIQSIKKNWFTAKTLANSFKNLTIREAEEKLQSLVALGFCLQKANFKTGEVLYKIILTEDDRLALLEQRKAVLLHALKEIDVQVSKIQHG